MFKKNITLHIIFSILIIANSGCCNYICDRMMFSRPNNEEFAYYDGDFEISDDTKLKTKSFYFYEGTGWDGEQYTPAYTYLSFKNDGTILYLSNTGITPKQAGTMRSIYNPKRKRNKRPKDIHDDFGFYKIIGDSLFFTIHKAGVLGSHLVLDWRGVIASDTTLILNDKLFVHYKNSANNPKEER